MTVAAINELKKQVKKGIDNADIHHSIKVNWFILKNVQFKNIAVVYFDKRTGATHTIGWYK